MNGTTVEYVSRHVEYTYDLVGNRSTMTVIEDDNAGFVARTLVTYDYDANDRLTRAVSDTDPISLSARDRFDRYYASRPSGWTRPAVLAFWGLCLTAFWAPLLPWRRILRARSASAGTPLSAVGASPTTPQAVSDADGGRLPLGRRARRKRLFTACVATFLVPLMAVQPDAVQALNTEALRAQTALTAGVLLDTDPTVTETIYTYDANGNQIGRETTQDGSTTTETYIFDAENRLAGYRKAVDGVLNHSSSASYTYDADGMRYSQYER